MSDALPENQATGEEMFLAQAIAFLSAERHKIDHPVAYAHALGQQFLDEARRVIAAISSRR